MERLDLLSCVVCYKKGFKLSLDNSLVKAKAVLTVCKPRGYLVVLSIAVLNGDGMWKVNC